MSTYPFNANINLGALPRDSWKDPARTDRTAAAMVAVIHSTERTGWVRTLAGKILHGRAPADGLGVVYGFLRTHMDFGRDPENVELVRHPDQLIAEFERTGRMHGDCDDLACLGAALVRALGYPAALIVAGRQADGPFEHVYYGAAVNGRLIPFDPQERVPPGQEHPAERRKVYAV